MNFCTLNVYICTTVTEKRASWTLYLISLIVFHVKSYWFSVIWEWINNFRCFVYICILVNYPLKIMLLSFTERVGVYLWRTLVKGAHRSLYVVKYLFPHDEWQSEAGTWPLLSFVHGHALIKQSDPPHFL